jgi:uncharacterized protein
MGPIRTPLPGGRWHFAHGPIELVIGADGAAHDVAAAHEAAWQRFETVLQALADELPLLRQPVNHGQSHGQIEQSVRHGQRQQNGLSAQHGPCPVHGPVAQRMWRACVAMPTDFITPMAAVAGAVAEEILTPYAQAGLDRAYVNNGGDIALHLGASASWQLGLVADISRTRPAIDGRFTVRGTDPVRGVATSGWRGRSQSLGIADAVTVLATHAATADAAATLIANAVNIDDPHIERVPAKHLRDDSDLGTHPVTVQVPMLAVPQVLQALQAGAAVARHLQALGLIHAAVLVCQGQVMSVQPPTALPLAA